MRLYTLGSRGSRELKTFLEIRLISSRIDQKLVFKGRIHRFLKEKLSRRSWAIDAVVGADLRRHGGIPLGGFVAPELAVNFASILLRKKPRSRLIVVTIKRRSVHDHEAIGPRSWPFLFPCSVGIVRRDRGIESMMKEPRSRLHRAAIAVRSDCDRGVLSRIFPAV